MTDSISYSPTLKFSENGTENNKKIFQFKDLPFPDQSERKKPIQPWELMADKIVEAFEFLLAFSVKSSIKQQTKSRSIIPIYITSATSCTQKSLKFFTNSISQSFSISYNISFHYL